MSSIGNLFWVLFKVLFLGLLLLLLILIIGKKYLGKRILPFFIAFLCLSFFGLYIHYGMKGRENLAAKKYLKEYKLKRLDEKDCNNCIVKINNNHQYDIIKNGQVIGNGKWDMEFESDAGFYFPRLENCPLYIIGEKDSIIEYINRPTK